MSVKKGMLIHDLFLIVLLHLGKLRGSILILKAIQRSHDARVERDDIVIIKNFHIILALFGNHKKGRKGDNHRILFFLTGRKKEHKENKRYIFFHRNTIMIAQKRIKPQ